MNEVNNNNLNNQAVVPDIQPEVSQSVGPVPSVQPEPQPVPPVQQPQPNPVIPQPEPQPVPPVQQPQPIQPGNIGNQEPNGNNKKSNKMLIICLILIIIALSVVVVYLLNNKEKTTEPKSDNNIPKTEETTNNINNQVTDNNQTTNNQVTDNNQVTNNADNKLNSNWINYLLSQDIIETKVSVYQPRQVNDNFTEKNFSLNKDELTKLLNKMAGVKLIKEYARGLGGGPTDSLNIKYKKNNVEYEFSIRYGLIFIDEKDTEIIKLFDNNNYEENTENKEYKDAIYYYSGIPNTLFEDYIK